MTQDDMLSINTVAAKLGLSVHQLRRWELMFGLEIKRGRGQQRQYRSEDLLVLERIKELVEQGWPTSQIRPQLEAEGLITPKLIGVPQSAGNPEMLMEAVIGLRSFAERRFTEMSKQIDELKQLVIAITLKNELQGEMVSPWQPTEDEFAPPSPAGTAPNASSFSPPAMPGPAAMPSGSSPSPAEMPGVSQPSPVGAMPCIAPPEESRENIGPEVRMTDDNFAPANNIKMSAAPSQPHFSAGELSPSKPPSVSLGDVTDQNFLTVLGKALDLIGWTDEQADEYSMREFEIEHWDELGRSQAEKLIAHLIELIESRNHPTSV